MHCGWARQGKGRPGLGGRGEGGEGRVGVGIGVGAGLRRPHSGLVQSLGQILLILPDILLQAIRPTPTTHHREKESGREGEAEREDEGDREG